jgi:hypothetical protein
MRLFRKEPITFEEKTYEIRVYYSDTIINVVTFLNNFPANGFRHQIQLPKKCNIQGVLKEVMLEELIEMSKKGIIEKTGERLTTIIQKNMRDTLE